MPLFLGVILLAVAASLRSNNSLSAFYHRIFIPIFFVAMLAYALNPAVGRYVFVTAGITGISTTISRVARSHQVSLSKYISTLNIFTEPVFWACTLCFWLTFTDGARSGFIISNVIEFVAQVLILISFSAAVRNGHCDLRFVVRSSLLFIGAALVLGAILHEQFISCTTDFGKCSVAGRLYAGIFDSENAIAIFSLMSLLLCFMLSKSWQKWIAIAALSAIVLITGSRTPLIAFATGVPLALLAARTSRKLDNGSYCPKAVVGILPAVAVPVIGLYLAHHVAPADFSNRGYIWIQMNQLVPWNSVSGKGKTIYQTDLADGFFRGHYPSSEYMLLMFFGGLVGIGLYSIFVLTLWRQARAPSRRILALHLLPVLVFATQGLDEVTWNAAALDQNLWVLLAAILGVYLAVDSAKMDVDRRVGSRNPASDSGAL